MLVTRRCFLKRAALWIAAPAIVKAANIMPVSALDDEYVRVYIMYKMRDLPRRQIEWIGSSVFFQR